MNLDQFNSLTNNDARAALLRCCGSKRWVEGMMARRAFASADALLFAADEISAELDRSEWLEAFAAHPRIGDIESLRAKFAATAGFCRAEQAGVTTADDETLRRLADGNRQYEERFGYIFIVCAAGKSAAEMLAILESRLNNDPETELLIAAGEQAKITRLRLEKL